MKYAVSCLTAFACLFAAPSAAAAGGLVINEVMASNGATLADEDGDHEEWIELYNAGDSVLDLEGFGLSDDYERPFRWVFPGIEVAPGGYLLVFASGKDRVTPWEEIEQETSFSNPTDQTLVLHTNFSIDREGEEVLLTDPNGVRVDELPPTPIPRDVSYGRKPDAAAEWVYFAEPTPGAANTSDGHVGLLEAPRFSHDPGFYENPIDLAITAEADAIIRYTLDGSEPTEASPVYEGPITLTSRDGDRNVYSRIPTTPDGQGFMPWREPEDEVFKANVVRAAAFRDGHIPSYTATAVYFNGEGVEDRYSFPVFSLVTDPDNLFSFERGILVPGAHYADDYPDEQWRNHGNYSQRGREWERPVHLTMFEEDGAVALAQDAGLRVHGGMTRRFAQKALRLYARAGYTNTHFEHRLFPDQDRNRFRRFILRASGNDATQTMFRDGLAQTLIADYSETDTQAFRPAIVFINGEYWGIQNVRERYDKHYIAGTYGVDPENLDLLAHDWSSLDVKEGDTEHYQAMLGFIQSADMTDPEAFAHVETLMDVDNFIDYQIAHIFVRNTDWPQNNSDFWRLRTGEYAPGAPRGHDGRWRWLVVDLDHGFGYIDAYDAPWHNTLAYAAGEEEGPFHVPDWALEPFRSLLANEEFRTRFINRFAGLLNTAFESGRILERIDEMKARLELEIDEHHARWRHPSGGRETWEIFIDIMRHFAEHRPGVVREHIVDFFGLDGAAELRVIPSRPQGGTVRVHKTELAAGDFPWVGEYFQGVPIRVEAIPAPGYRFAGWRGLTGVSEAVAHVTLGPDGGVLRPVFAPEEAYGGDIEPRPHRLSDGPYVFTEWPPGAEAGTYPPNMVFRQTSTSDPGLGDPMEEAWTLEYDRTSRSRVTGEGADGFAFINTSNPQEDGGGYLGSAELALDTRGRTGVVVSWTGGTVLPNNRHYAIRLQYRVGAEGPWRDVRGAGGVPVEYYRHPQAGHAQSFGPTPLPPAVDNHPYVQLRWRYYAIDRDISGPRAQLRVGGVTVGSVAMAPLTLHDLRPREGFAAGGVSVTASADGLTPTAQLLIGGEPAFPLEELSKDVRHAEFITPALPPGAHPVTLVDAASGAIHESGVTFTVMDTPFSAGQDWPRGTLRPIPDNRPGVHTAAGLFERDASGALQALTYETPEGVIIHAPVEALPPDTANAFLFVRSAAKPRALFDDGVAPPDGMALESPAVDVQILLESSADGDVRTWERAEDASVGIAFPWSGGVAEALLRGGHMEAWLDADYGPAAPDPARLAVMDTRPQIRDEGDYAEVGADEPGAYALVALLRRAEDINSDGVVDALDVQLVINAALGRALPDGIDAEDADVTGDGMTNATDVQRVINAALGRF